MREGWNIAPALLAQPEQQAEVLGTLAECVRQRGETTLRLFQCPALSDLAPLQGLAGLQRLFLNGCTGVSDWSVARGLKKRGAHVSGLPA